MNPIQPAPVTTLHMLVFLLILAGIFGLMLLTAHWLLPSDPDTDTRRP